MHTTCNTHAKVTLTTFIVALLATEYVVLNARILMAELCENCVDLPERQQK